MANWKRIGSAIYIDGGGFDVRFCPEPEATAQKIVTAVNYHEKLSKVLRDGQNVWGEYLTTGGGSPVAHRKFVNAARKFMDESEALLSELEAEK